MKKWLLTLLGLSSPLVFASTYTLPLPNDGLVGKPQIAFSKKNETIQQVAREHDIGFYEILEANSKINPEQIKPWNKLIIPSQFVLPDTEKEGIVINKAELRLYYYPPNSNKVITYPVAIGMQRWDTPAGEFDVIEKMDHPPWYVPVSVAKDMAKKGIFLPKVQPPGPDNPLGEYALRLSARSYLLHGTNVPETVGRRASAGCLHLYPEDIKVLYDTIPLGTKVTIIDQPFKAGWSGNTLYFQATQPLHEDRVNWSRGYSQVWRPVILNTLAEKNGDAKSIDWQAVKEIVAKQDGIAYPIAKIG